jgi:hypothetical protein
LVAIVGVQAVKKMVQLSYSGTAHGELIAHKITQAQVSLTAAGSG